eukprot:9756359-Heterocapsa_arctica.AAC.1
MLDCGVPGNCVPRQMCTQCGCPNPMWGAAKADWQQMGHGKIGKGKERACHRRGTVSQITREIIINGTMVPLGQWQS